MQLGGCQGIKNNLYNRYRIILCSLRLSVRTLDFQSRKTGSTPVGSTIFTASGYDTP